MRTVLVACRMLLVVLAAIPVCPAMADALPVTLVEPADGAVLDTIAPRLTVDLQKSGDVMAANIEVSTSPDFQGGAHGFGFVVLDNGVSTKYNCTNAKRATTYYWRARAWHGGDMNNPVYGEYTPMRSFTTGSGAGLPAAPELISPANGFRGARRRYFINLSWSQPADDVVEYVLFKHRQGTDSTVFAYVPDSSPTTPVTQGEVGYWWVRARNAAGWGPVSGYRHYIIPVWESEYTQDEPIEGYVPLNPYTDADDDQPGPEPQPDPLELIVNANGVRGQLALGTGDALNVSVSLRAGQYSGYPVDWWLVARERQTDAWYYMGPDFQWTPFDGNLLNCRPVLMATLADLPETPVLSDYVPAAGIYDFWFAVDYPLDGVLHPAPGYFAYDLVTVMVE